MATRQDRATLIKGGAVISVDPGIGTLPMGDVLVRDGAIGFNGVGVDFSV